MKKQRIELELSSYDHRLLDQAVKWIVSAAKKTGANVVGPIPLRNKTRRITVLRSPHVDKKSREQFELTEHKRILGIESSDRTMEALMKLNISSSVHFRIK
jgi:small subunit ribosomal protein S10